MVPLMRVSSSSPPRMASCKCLGVGYSLYLQILCLHYVPTPALLQSDTPILLQYKQQLSLQASKPSICRNPCVQKPVNPTHWKLQCLNDRITSNIRHLKWTQPFYHYMCVCVCAYQPFEAIYTLLNFLLIVVMSSMEGNPSYIIETLS